MPSKLAVLRAGPRHATPCPSVNLPPGPVRLSGKLKLLPVMEATVTICQLFAVPPPLSIALAALTNATFDSVKKLKLFVLNK